MFCFHGVECSDQKSLYRKMLYSHDTKNSLVLISARASIDVFPPTNRSSPVRGCQIGSILSSFVTSCINISPIFSRNLLCLKSQILLFCTITHAGLFKLLNNHSDLEVVSVEAHIVDRLRLRILLLIIKI